MSNERIGRENKPNQISLAHAAVEVNSAINECIADRNDNKIMRTAVSGAEARLQKMDGRTLAALIQDFQISPFTLMATFAIRELDQFSHDEALITRLKENLRERLLFVPDAAWPKPPTE